MLRRNLTPFSSIMCDTAWISVVDRIGSSGDRRPLLSIRCEAKMVLINVDLPSPVWPDVHLLLA